MPRKSAQVAPDPVESAAAAGLRYVSDSMPGISRVRSGSGFRYKDAAGKPVRDEQVLGRIRSLVIPPAWQRVWICPIANGHIQAIGWDARGRKQYRYHPRWRQERDAAKYGQMLAFAKALPKLRRRIRHDLKLPGLPREKVLAAVVSLLEKTLIRVGNDEYAKDNHSYGLTTLRDRHAKVKGSRVSFSFQGKSGVRHEIDLEDPVLAKIVRQCQDLPGQELFQYVDDQNEVRDVYSQDVNDYISEISGQHFTAKDFRTWAGTTFAAKALQQMPASESQAMAKRNVVAAIRQVAEMLGNTIAVCRKCYIHPVIINCYLEGSLTTELETSIKLSKRTIVKLSADEAGVWYMLYRFEKSAIITDRAH